MNQVLDAPKGIKKLLIFRSCAETWTYEICEELAKRTRNDQLEMPRSHGEHRASGEAGNFSDALSSPRG